MWSVWTRPRTRWRVLLSSAIIWLPPLLLRPLGTGRDAWLVYLGLVPAALLLATWTTALGERRSAPPPPPPPDPGAPGPKGRRPR